MIPFQGAVLCFHLQAVYPAFMSDAVTTEDPAGNSVSAEIRLARTAMQALLTGFRRHAPVREQTTQVKPAWRAIGGIQLRQSLGEALKGVILDRIEASAEADHELVAIIIIAIGIAAVVNVRITMAETVVSAEKKVFGEIVLQAKTCLEILVFPGDLLVIILGELQVTAKDRVAGQVVTYI